MARTDAITTEILDQRNRWLSCTAAIVTRQCRLWVGSDQSTMDAQCPLTHRKLPRRRPTGASAKGQEPPPAPQQDRVTLNESCLRDVPKVPVLSMVAWAPTAGGQFKNWFDTSRNTSGRSRIVLPHGEGHAHETF